MTKFTDLSTTPILLIAHTEVVLSRLSSDDARNSVQNAQGSRALVT